MYRREVMLNHMAVGRTVVATTALFATFFLTDPAAMTSRHTIAVARTAKPRYRFSMESIATRAMPT